MFNPYSSKPAEEVIFTNRNSTSYENVSSGVDVMSVDNHKHLGFILYSKLNYIKHKLGLNMIVYFKKALAHSY
jgi:hypothetical protein